MPRNFFQEISEAEAELRDRREDDHKPRQALLRASAARVNLGIVFENQVTFTMCIRPPVLNVLLVTGMALQSGV